MSLDKILVKENEENEGLINAYSILDIFLPTEMGGSPDITGFVDRILLGSESDGGNDKTKKCIRSFEEKGFDLCNEPLTFALEYAHLYFAIGYVLGQTFDISPGDDDRGEALKTIKALKKELKQAGILPFWPRNLTSTTSSL